MTKHHPEKTHSVLWAALLVSLPILYVMMIPAFYVVAETLGVSEEVLEYCCAPYEQLERNEIVGRPLIDYWFFWMRVGYGD